MDYEKLYKEALERARDLHDNHALGMPFVYQTCEDIFPELKESEDKEIHDLWVYIREWNEKFGRLPKDEDELAACIDYVMKRQKPTDKIEPKFKVGDWVVKNNGSKFTNGCKSVQVTKIDEKGHIWFTSGTWLYEEDIYLWTILDANNGDVLVINNEVFIYAHRKQLYSIAVAHCFIDSVGTFHFDGEFGYMENRDSIHPATKEQCDILFQKMKEAGYEWDDEKNELKKIEHISAEWNEEDEELKNSTILYMQGMLEGAAECENIEDIKEFNKIISWLKSIKDRVQSWPKQE